MHDTIWLMNYVEYRFRMSLGIRTLAILSDNSKQAASYRSMADILENKIDFIGADYYPEFTRSVRN